MYFYLETSIPSFWGIYLSLRKYIYFQYIAICTCIFRWITCNMLRWAMCVPFWFMFHSCWKVDNVFKGREKCRYPLPVFCLFVCFKQCCVVNFPDFKNFNLSFFYKLRMKAFSLKTQTVTIKLYIHLALSHLLQASKRVSKESKVSGPWENE